MNRQLQQNTPSRSCHREQPEPPARPDLVAVDQMLGTWTVVVVDPHRESLVHAKLNLLRGVPCFWPRERYVHHTEVDAHGHRHQHKRMRSLFPGYLSFCLRDADDADAVHRCELVRDRVRVVNQLRFRRQIVALDHAIAADPALTTSAVRPGLRYHITDGPWRGNTATVDRVQGHRRVFVDLELFGRSVETEIDPALLNPV